MHDQIAGDGPAPDSALAEAADVAELMAVVNELPPRHATIVAHRFVDGMTLDETAEAVAPFWKGRVLSRERVRQIEISALEILRRKLGSAARAA